MSVLDARSSAALPPTPPRSSREELEKALQELRSDKDAWISLPIAQRIDILEQLIQGSTSITER